VTRLTRRQKLGVVIDAQIGFGLIAAVTSEALFGRPRELARLTPMASKTGSLFVRTCERPGVIQAIRMPGRLRVTDATGRGPHPWVLGLGHALVLCEVTARATLS
jgi:hypothetical protein